MLSKLFRSTIARVHKGIDGIGDFTCWIVLMKLSFYSFFAEFSIELDRGHMRKPKVLLLSTVIFSCHFEVKLHLSLVLRFVHEKGDFKGIVWQKHIAVTADDIDQLV
jgi:hypothetical protein